MRRLIVCELDSLGIGSAPEADRFGDTGADTLGHIAEWCAEGKCDDREGSTGKLHIPNLVKLGMGKAAEGATGRLPPGLNSVNEFTGAYGWCQEKSRGKDTPSGHWESMGAPCEFEWGYFDGEPVFPQKLLDELQERSGVPGFLGLKAASGTEIIAELGEESVKTGKPIVYTSADSVFQIAAHEQTFGLQRLYDLCHTARELVDEYNIGRVIARPFAGTSAENFTRTNNRKDLAVPPHMPTLLNHVSEAGNEVIAIGKISDIFAGSGVSRMVKAYAIDGLMNATLQAMDEAGDGAFIFTNFVDFDMVYGHRRNVPGYAQALELFDRRLPELQAKMQDGDLLILTADHGCDPSWPGSDHTREYVPFIAYGKNVPVGPLGKRDSFADIGETGAKWLGLRGFGTGKAAF